jgi:diguanylate cyclase (GGDEF)-like protein
MMKENETISIEGPIDLYEGIVTVPPALVIVYGSSLGKAYYLQEENLSIGRSLTCDIHLDEDSISRRHARITVDQNVTTVYDLDSTNGTFVNGYRVQSAVLKDGDRIHLGETVLKYLSRTNAETKFHEDIYHLMTVDELTQAFNRQFFLDALQRELSRARRYQRRMSLAMLDIDQFKAINDNHGHPAGDAILKAFVGLVRSNLRQSDLLARYGGDEFALILPEAGPVSAMRCCEKLCAAIASHTFRYKQTKIAVTTSIGLQCYEHTDGEVGHNQLVAAADARLYEAKQAGRNRVCAGVFD